MENVPDCIIIFLGTIYKLLNPMAGVFRPPLLCILISVWVLKICNFKVFVLNSWKNTSKKFAAKFSKKCLFFSLYQNAGRLFYSPKTRWLFQLFFCCSHGHFRPNFGIMSERSKLNIRSSSTPTAASAERMIIGLKYTTSLPPLFKTMWALTPWSDGKDNYLSLLILLQNLWTAPWVNLQNFKEFSKIFKVQPKVLNLAMGWIQQNDSSWNLNHLED